MGAAYVSLKCLPKQVCRCSGERIKAFPWEGSEAAPRE
jgi:hypothetical protein